MKSRPRVRVGPEEEAFHPHPHGSDTPHGGGRVYVPPEESLIEGVLLSRSLHEYCVAAWHVVNPVGVFVDGWHIGAMCEHLEAVSRGQIKRLLINIPYRCTKSLTLVFWQTWEWTFAPHTQWLCMSYAQELSTRDSLRSRTVVESKWYRERWGDVVCLSADQSAKNRFENTERGYRIASSITGLGTGEGGNRVVLDDVHNMQEIHSEVARKEVIRIWRESLSSRLNDPPNDAFVGVMQRGHEQDWSGYILREEGTVQSGGVWEHLCIPMEYERMRPVYVRAPDGSRTIHNVDAQTVTTSLGFRDPRKEPGELLSPTRFPPSVIASLKLAPYAWAGQAQQRPSPASGGLFLRDKWRFYRRTEIEGMQFDEVVQSWDMAFKETTTSSRVAGHVWARRGADKYLLARVCEAMDFMKSCRAVVQMSNDHPQALRKLIEDKANGPAVISMLRSKVVGLHPVEPRGSKEARAQTASVHQQSENLYLPVKEECAWTEELIDILAGVPRGEWDDCDALSQAMIYFGPAREPIKLDDSTVLVEAGMMGAEGSPWSNSSGGGGGIEGGWLSTTR